MNAHNKKEWQRRRALKLEMIKAYDNICVCCKEDKQEFLTLDHKKNNGKKHRLDVFGPASCGRGSQLHWFLKKKGWPRKDLQLMCWNCNIAKHIYGKCPHKKTKRGSK